MLYTYHLKALWERCLARSAQLLRVLYHPLLLSYDRSPVHSLFISRKSTLRYSITKSNTGSLRFETRHSTFVRTGQPNARRDPLYAMSGLSALVTSSISAPRISASYTRPTLFSAVSGSSSDFGRSGGIVSSIWSNNTHTRDCWAQWTDYWGDMNSSMSAILTTQTLTSTLATDFTYFHTTSIPLTTSVTIETYYETGSEANHDAFATFTYEETQTVTLGGQFSSPTSTRSVIYSTLTKVTTRQIDEYLTSVQLSGLHSS